MTEQNVRPAAPGPNIEDELRKAVAGRHGHRMRDASDAGKVDLTGPGAFIPYSPGAGGVFAAKAAEGRPMPSGQYIASRLGRSLDRLRSVEAYAESIAVTLAGPNPATQIGAKAPPDTPASSLFVIYERTLDEIDRIIDNIENEQARARNILGE